MRGFLLAAPMFIVFAFASQPAYAVLMTDLFGGEEIVVGDKRFFEWTLVADDSITGGGAADPRDFSLIDVTPITTAPSVHGLRYTDSVADPQMFSPGGTLDLVSFTFTYRVEQTGGLPIIIGNELEMTSFDVGSSGDFAFVDINEGVFKSDTITDIGHKEVFAFGDDPGNEQPFDSAVFAAESALFVETTIELSSGFADAARLSVFEQTFSQESQVIPEPSTFVVFSVGLASWLPFCWRRRRRPKLAA